MHNHYQYRDVIDNHNSARMHSISMEEMWMTMCWPNRVFCFLLAMTMVNVQNTATYFLKKPKLDILHACCLIAKALINNVHLHTSTTPLKHPKCRSIEHVLTMVPPYKFFSRATHQLQDNVWQVGMHRLHSHCEVVLFVYTRTDVLH